MKKRNWTHGLLGSALVLGTIGVQAAPVVYTLQTVGDGKLGSHPFAEAVITMKTELEKLREQVENLE
jgi:hypothetical protein